MSHEHEHDENCGCDELTNIEVVVFEDEDGLEVEMEIIDEFDHDGTHYAALREIAEEIPEDEEEDIINFFAVTKEANGDDDAETFDLVEDEALLNQLCDALEERLLAKS